MPRRFPTAIGLLLAIGVVASPASADWTAPTPPFDRPLQAGTLTVDRAGDAALFGNVFLDRQEAPFSEARVGIADGAGNVESTVIDFPLGSFPFPAQIVAAGDSVVIAGVGNDPERTTRFTILFASGTRDSPPAASRTIAAQRAGYFIENTSLELVAAPDGTATLAWTETQRGGRGLSVARAAVVSPRGRVRTRTLSTGGAQNRSVRLGIDARGRVIATWLTSQRRGVASVVTRVATRPGAWGPRVSERLPGLPTGLGSELEVLTDASGGQHAFWENADRGGRRTLRSAHRRAGGRFGPSLVLARVGGDVPVLESTSFAVGPRGHAAALFIVPAGRQPPADPGDPPLARGSLQARIAAPGGRWGGTQRLTGRRAVLGAPAVAVDGRGRAVALWQQGGAGSPGVSLSTATASRRGRFAASTVLPGTERRACEAPIVRLAASGRGAALACNGAAWELLRYRP